jgi:hypothetical protein
MGCLEGSGVPVLYTGRTVSKGLFLLATLFYFIQLYLAYSEFAALSLVTF